MSNSIQTITLKFKETPVNIRKHIKPDTPISCSEQVYGSFRILFQNEVKERFVVIWLNAINCVIGFEVKHKKPTHCIDIAHKPQTKELYETTLLALQKLGNP